MGDYLLTFLLVMLLVAALTREDFLFTLVYLLLGVFVAATYWGRQVLKNIRVERLMEHHLFLGERRRVEARLTNLGVLPAAWLQVQEALPVELGAGDVVRHVFSVGPRRQVRLEYWMEGRRRGYFAVGPMRLYSGDVLGVVDEAQGQFPEEYVTVYPRMVALTRVPLPPSAPSGTLRSTQPVFEDPTRVKGKRDYIPGDSLRQVDWKSTASTGRLQVKLYEPSIALETVIFLNFFEPDYEARLRYDSTELGVIVAASLAAWVIGQRQSAGLVSNGIDPLSGESPQPLPARRGRGHLMRLLEVLARVEPGKTLPLADLVRRERVHLNWGATLLLVTGAAGEDVFDALFQARRAGLGVMLVLVGRNFALPQVRNQSLQFNMPCYLIEQESDLDQWRR